ncbi:hypothetical protein E4U61_004343 [Claviceps capensis]|nr:hypothetical protein E4U61_004343 [Claviceps capensis]
MATPPQGAGNSDDLRTPVNATQGAQDALVSDTYQFNFDDFLGPRSPDLMHHDAAQHGSSKSPTPAAPEQYADRLIGELDRDRAVKMRLFRDMCAAFDQEAAGYASGPGHTLAQDFKQFYMGFWTAALKGESPPSPSRAAAPKPAAKPTTYASVASRPEDPTTYTLKKLSARHRVPLSELKPRRPKTVASWLGSNRRPQRGTQTHTRSGGRSRTDPTSPSTGSRLLPGRRQGGRLSPRTRPPGPSLGERGVLEVYLRSF